MTAATLLPPAVYAAGRLGLAAQALSAGFRLSYDAEQNCYWLSWRNLAQPCPTLAAVAAALEPGSAWRQVVTWAKLESNER